MTKLEANKINGVKFPENSLYLFADGQIIIKSIASWVTLFEGKYSDFSDNTNTPFTSVEAIVAYWNLNFNVDPDATATNQINGGQKTQIVNADGSAVTSLGGNQFSQFAIELARPADMTPYAVNEVIADVSAAFKQFANVARNTGLGIKITRVRLQTDDTNVAGKKFNLHIYSDAPTFIADNNPFVVSYANAAKRAGSLPIVMGTGNLGTVGHNDYDHVILNPVARDVYFILETVDGFTPSANSTKFTVVIDCELSN